MVLLAEMLLIREEIRCFRIMFKFKEWNLDLYTDLNNVLCKQNITQMEEVLFDEYIENWQNRILTQDVGKKLRI